MISNWLEKHTYEAHSTAFGLMVLSSAGLYFAARVEALGWILGLLGIFILGNILALLVK
jgi:hypothetical protein